MKVTIYSLIICFHFLYSPFQKCKIFYFRFTDDVTKVLPPTKLISSFSELATETAHRYTLSYLEEATGNFAKRIGSGGFGIVYYGKTKDGKEIAVKVLLNDSYQGTRQFKNEVSTCKF